jgi:DNA polymerase
MDIKFWVRRQLPELSQISEHSESMNPAQIHDILPPTPQMPPPVSPMLASPPENPQNKPPLNVPPPSEVELIWQELQQRVTTCTACELHQTRTRTVFGTGYRRAQWMFVGEAPGADEDLQGEPFVGRAGKLLTSMILALKLSREQVYIANILKCRPPNNRNPLPHEVVCCTPFLTQQIELIRPAVIVALGAVAARFLLHTETEIGKLRGQRHEYENTGIPLIATYHPAYLLRNPVAKSKSWQDLQLASQMIHEHSL